MTKLQHTPSAIASMQDAFFNITHKAEEFVVLGIANGLKPAISPEAFQNVEAAHVLFSFGLVLAKAFEATMVEEFFSLPTTICNGASSLVDGINSVSGFLHHS